MNGRELWASTGKASGTKLVLDIRPGNVGSSPRDLRAAGKRVFFVANESDSDQELWVSTGKAKGTVKTRDIVFPGSSAPRDSPYPRQS